MNGFLITFLVLEVLMTTFGLTVGWALSNTTTTAKTLGGVTTTVVITILIHALGITGVWIALMPITGLGAISYWESLLIALLIPIQVRSKTK